MRVYIGTKIIQAEEMDRATFFEHYRPDETLAAVNEPGYHVMYPDSYHSWSPKAVFEEAYRVVNESERESLRKCVEVGRI